MSEEQEIRVAKDGLMLPFSAEAEQSVLGSILLNADCLVDVMELLPTSDYFHLSTHKVIYQCMLELFTLNHPVDVVTVLEKLKNREGYSDAETKNYLMQLAQFVPKVHRVKEYAGIVRDNYQLRKLILSAREIIDSAESPEGDISRGLGINPQNSDIHKKKEKKNKEDNNQDA